MIQIDLPSEEEAKFLYDPARLETLAKDAEEAGYEKGFAKGYQEGYGKGMMEESRRMLKLLSSSYTTKELAKALSLTEEEVQALLS